ncbi:MAG: hypothetical protein GX558_01555 [Clostridiales bacterium]|nr:hypothetical protein [Clostridiales bacterium]
MRWALATLLLFWLLPIGSAAAVEATPAPSGELDRALAGVDQNAWQQAADGAGVDLDAGALIGRLAKGEPLGGQDVLAALADTAMGELRLLLPDLMLLLGPALLWAINRQLLTGEGQSLSGAAGYLCYLVEAGVLIRLFGSQAATARQVVMQMDRLMEFLSPTLAAMLAAVGGASSAAALEPLSAIAGSMLSTLINRVALTLSACGAAFAVLGNLNERMTLHNLYKLCKSTHNWLLGVAMAGFIGVLTVNGMMGASRDGLSIRTVRYTVRNMVPAVGREVADTLDTVVASALLVKNAAGVTGLILLVSLCMRPLIHVAMVMLACRLSAALVEPVASGPVTALIEQFAGVMQMLLVALIAGAVLLIVTVGAMLTAGNVIAMLR